jgi:hypothetical protein
MEGLKRKRSRKRSRAAEERVGEGIGGANQGSGVDGHY